MTLHLIRIDIEGVGKFDDLLTSSRYLWRGLQEDLIYSCACHTLGMTCVWKRHSMISSWFNIAVCKPPTGPPLPCISANWKFCVFVEAPAFKSPLESRFCPGLVDCYNNFIITQVNVSVNNWMWWKVTSREEEIVKRDNLIAVLLLAN